MISSNHTKNILLSVYNYTALFFGLNTKAEMRKILLQYTIVICLCSSILAVSAQTPSASSTPAYDIPGYMGIKAGLNVSNIVTLSSNPLAKGYTPISGFTGGYFLDLPIYNWLSFQPELNFQQQGAARNGLQAIANPSSLITGNYAYANFNNTDKLSYLQIPLEAKFIWNVSRTFKFYANAGPFVEFMIGGKSTSTGTSDVYSDAAGHYPVVANQSYNITQNIQHNLHAVNAGGIGALGLSLNTKTGRLYLEAGGNLGFVNIQRHTGAIGRNYDLVHNFQIGYAILLKGVHG